MQLKILELFFHENTCDFFSICYVVLSPEVIEHLQVPERDVKGSCDLIEAGGMRLRSHDGRCGGLCAFLFLPASGLSLEVRFSSVCLCLNGVHSPASLASAISSPCVGVGSFTPRSNMYFPRNQLPCPSS